MYLAIDVPVFIIFSLLSSFSSFFISFSLFLEEFNFFSFLLLASYFLLAFLHFVLHSMYLFVLISPLLFNQTMHRHLCHPQSIDFLPMHYAATHSFVHLFCRRFDASSIGIIQSGGNCVMLHLFPTVYLLIGKRSVWFQRFA